MQYHQSVTQANRQPGYAPRPQMNRPAPQPQQRAPSGNTAPNSVTSSSYRRDRQQFSVSGATRWVTMLDSALRILPTPTQGMLMAALPELLLQRQLSLVLALRQVDKVLVLPTTLVEAG